MDKIWEEIRANSRKLESCKKHSFKKSSDNTRYYCEHCGGWTNVSGVHWYEQGLKHGGNNTDESLSH